MNYHYLGKNHGCLLSYRHIDCPISYLPELRSYFSFRASVISDVLVLKFDVSHLLRHDDSRRTELSKGVAGMLPHPSACSSRPGACRRRPAYDLVGPMFKCNICSMEGCGPANTAFDETFIGLNLGPRQSMLHFKWTFSDKGVLGRRGE